LLKIGKFANFQLTKFAVFPSTHTLGCSTQWLSWSIVHVSVCNKKTDFHMCVNVKYINLPNWWFSPHKSSRKSQAATNTLKKK